MTPASSYLNSAIAALCLAFCLAQDARAQATSEQKAYAESQRQKREAAESKRAAAQQKQRDNLERQRQQNAPNDVDRQMQRQQQWDRASDAIREERSGANIGKSQSLSGSTAPPPPPNSSIGKPQSLTAPVSPRPPARTGPYAIPDDLGTQRR